MDNIKDNSDVKTRDIENYKKIMEEVNRSEHFESSYSHGNQKDNGYVVMPRIITAHSLVDVRQSNDFVGESDGSITAHSAVGGDLMCEKCTDECNCSGPPAPLASPADDLASPADDLFHHFAGDVKLFLDCVSKINDDLGGDQLDSDVTYDLSMFTNHDV